MKKSRFLSLLLPILLCVNSVQAQWTDISIPYPYALAKGSFVNDNLGYVMADGYPMIFKTTNGGSSWDSVIINPGVGAIDIEFISADTGFVLVDSGAITMLKTTFNGGNSWISDTLPAGDVYNMMRFTDASNGFVTGIFSIVYHTTNGGQNWTPLPMGGYSSANDKEHVGADTIIFTGWDGTFAYRGSVIRRDGIGTFQERIFGSDYSTFSGTHFLNGNLGFAVFTKGFPVYDNYFVRTTNGGTSWDTIHTDTTTAFAYTDVFMTNGTEGYITNQTGATSTILKVNGSTSTLDYTSNFALKRFHRGGNTLFALGEGGKVVKRNQPLAIDETVVTALQGIYPNPTSDFLNLPIELVSDISVLDMNGKMVLSTILTPGQILSLGQLSNGMYVIMVKNAKGVSAGRVIVNK